MNLFYQKWRYGAAALVLAAIVACAGPDFDMSGPNIIPLTPQNAASFGAPAIQKAAAAAAKTNVTSAGEDEGAYRIGPGDKLLFALYVIDGREGSKRIYPPMTSYSSDPSQQIAVRQDGSIDVPYVGRVVVKDKTESEALAMLRKQYGRYFKQPEVELRVAEFNARRVVISGEVVKPGEQAISHKELSIIKALEAAGGVSADAALTDAELTHANGKKEKIDLQAMLYEGDLTNNRVLSSGDALYVPTNHRNKVFVMGEVVKPAAQSIKRGRLTLTEALADAGGLDKVTASAAGVYVIRGAVSEAMVEKKADLTTPPAASGAASANPVQVAVYSLDVHSPDAFVVGDQFMLHPRDVVYVSSRDVTEWSRFITQLIPSSVQSILYGSLYDN